jgi:peroxiredoxin
VERQYEERIQFLGIAWQDTREAMQAFVDQYGLRMPTAVDEDGSLFGRFGFSYQPAWAFVNDDGKVKMIFGELGATRLEEEIRSLLRA